MEVILYHTKDDENVINKQLEKIDEFDIVFKNRVDIISPVLPLKFNDVEKVFNSNYMEIPELKRFYFVRGIESENKDVWNISLECDVLESFKEDILNSHVKLNRAIQTGDYMDVSTDSEVIRDIDIYKSDVTLEKDDKMIFSTMGGVK